MAIASQKTPTALGVTFYAVLMALLGAILGFVYMVSFSAQAFASQAEYEASLLEDATEGEASGASEPTREGDESAGETAGGTLGFKHSGPKPGDAYYIEGEVLGSRTWEAKRAQLMSAGNQTVRLSVGEINAWMASKFITVEAAGAELSEEEEKASLLIMPGSPNVGIADSQEFFINLPTTLSSFGSSGDFTVSVRCAMDAARVKLLSVNVRSAKVPFPGLLGAKLLGFLMKSYKSTEEYQIISAALARAESIEVAGDEFVLELR